MKRVLIIAGKLYIGGAERVCRNIGYYSNPALFQIDYLVFGEKVEAYEPELLEKGCRIWHMPSPGEGYLRFYRDLKRLIRENRYDIVHSHTMFNSGIVLLAAKRCAVPIRIAHSHSICGPERRSFMQSFYEKSMRKLILRSATHYIGCGQAAGEWLFGKRAFCESGLVLLNGIELEQFRYDSVQRAKIRSANGWENKLVIGHTGHLAAVKNQMFLLRLMPKILERQPNAHLVLLGEGADRAMLEQTVQDLKLEKVVTMPGNVNNVNEYLSAFDVFAFPSLYEGMPLSILEVQANGLPCIISDRVPKDVFLTDLLRPCSLEAPAPWIEQILAARRHAPERYLLEMQNTSADIHHMLTTVYQIYQDGQSEYGLAHNH